MLDENRMRAMATRIRSIAERPDWRGHCGLVAAERPAHRARPHAARCHWRHLRKPPECHRRRWCAVPQSRQPGDPARRFGLGEFLLRHPRLHGRGFEDAGLPEDAIQRVPVTDRAAVGEMLKGLGGNLDVIVPRGGKSLVARVQNDARVPVFAHLEGICHVYVDRSADLEMARRSLSTPRCAAPASAARPKPF